MEIIGEQEATFFYTNSTWDVKCPGIGNHLEPKVTKKKRFFGLIQDVKIKYSETFTSSHYSEYIGPLNRFWIWIAFFGSKNSTGGLIVNNNWAWRHGLFSGMGEGWDELKK